MKRPVANVREETDKKAIKKCFVICPIGESGTPVRRRSDQILKHIIKPVVERLGYQALRSDDISAPGVITSQIIQHLIDDELVIADLTDGNPNVYYELAVRHVTKKPIVQMIHEGQKPSFDVTVQRTISFDFQDLDSVEKCKRQLEAQITAVEKDPKKIDSPISQAFDIHTLSKSEQPIEQFLAQIMQMLQRISDEVCSPEPSSPSVTLKEDEYLWRQRPVSIRPSSFQDSAEPASATQVNKSVSIKPSYFQREYLDIENQDSK